MDMHLIGMKMSSIEGEFYRMKYYIYWIHFRKKNPDDTNPWYIR
jgi:hypothetical protein